jgi:hypothetical protein
MKAQQRRGEQSREFRLAIETIVWPPSPQKDDAIRGLSQTIDWSLFLEIVDRHRIAGLAHQSLSAAKVALPCDMAAALAARANRDAAREMLFAHEAARLQKLLSESGAPALILKGPALALKAFGRLGLRYNHDIDILISEPTLRHAVQTLEEAGYARIIPQQCASADEVRRWIELHKDMTFQRKDVGIIVELHWRLFDNPYTFPVEVALSEPVVLSLGSTKEIKALPDEIELTYLCVHGVEHAWSRLKWLADVGALLSGLDAATLERHVAWARQHDLDRAILSTLSICHDLLHMAVPIEMLAAAKADWRIRWLTRVALRSMSEMDVREIEDVPFATTLKNTSHYFLRDEWRYWWREFRYDMTDMADMPLPPHLQPIAPVLRPFIWMAKQARLGVRKN